MTLRLFFTCALLLVLPACGNRAPHRPDVLLILVDTLRLDRTSLFDVSLTTTPNLRACGERGLVFTQAIAPSSWTVPSVAAIFAGKDVAHNRFTAFDDAPSLAERFAAAGYETRALVANPLVSRASGLARGFQSFQVAPVPTSVAQLEADMAKLRARWGGRALVERALALWRAPHESPLFLYVHFMDPHLPYDPANATIAPAVPGWSAGPVEGEPPPVSWTQRLTGEQSEELCRLRRMYDGQVLFLDRQLGRLFRELREDRKEGARSSRPFLVALTADHGEGLLEHLRNPDHKAKPRPTGMAYYTHGYQRFEGALRVPLLLMGAGVPRGRRERRQVAVRDLGATLLTLAGLPGAGRHLPLGESDGARKVVLGADRMGWFARTESFKLLVPDPQRANHPGVGARLFAMLGEEYAREVDDLKDRRSDVAARLIRRLKTWRENRTEENLPPADPETLRRMRAMGYLGK